jgi:hypothetical protein
VGFPDNKEADFLAESIYAEGGYIASVCHGEAGLVNLKDADGTPLVRGKKVNGFTNEEEKLNGTDKMVPLSPEDELKKDGAEFVKGDPYTEFAVEDQRFITGQNPMSIHKVAEMLAGELKNEGREDMQKDIGAVMGLYPMPTTLVGTVLEDGRVNFLPIAHVGSGGTRPFPDQRGSGAQAGRCRHPEKRCGVGQPDQSVK